MSLILDTLEKKTKEAKRLLGISYEQFNKLVDLVKQLHEEQIELKEKQKVRIIAAGGGNKPKLSIKDQVLLTIIYLRHNPTFQMLGIQFEGSESTARNPTKVFPVLGFILQPNLQFEIEKLSEIFIAAQIFVR